MAKKTLPNSEMIDSGDDFEVIYKANAPLIYRFMFWRTRDEMLAQDLTSHVFEKAWRRRASFKGGSAKAWLYKIANNTLIDHWRSRQETVSDEALWKIQSDTMPLSESLDLEMSIDTMLQALAKLPTDMRLVVEMRFIEGQSVREAARKLGLSEANVRVIQYRALRKLRGNLQ